MEDWKMRGKEADPEETIKKTESILDSFGIRTSEKDCGISVENCHSCRLSVDNYVGGLIGSNGKGMTKALSGASAHGELMERLQNRMFLQLPRFDDENFHELVLKDAPLYSPCDTSQPDCVFRLKERIAATIDKKLFMLDSTEFVDGLLKSLAPKAFDGKFPTLPFYSLKDKKTVYIPDWFQFFTGSNGMAAGNTLEEAIVEGISEILERYCQGVLLDGQIVPPQIPSDCIAKYPHILNVIKNIESSGRYKVRILDCSLGRKIPAVCGVITDTVTGNFGLKFGAQPNMAVALERIFTEALQGVKLETFANFSQPDFYRTKSNARIDKWNAVKVNSASTPAQFLMDSPDYAFAAWDDVSGLNNRQIMHKLLRLLNELGADVYIRDASYMGFPAVNIYASGISEARPTDILELKYLNLAYRVQQYFLHINRLTKDEISELLLFAVSRCGSVLENTISAMSGLCFTEEMPGAPFEADFLSAACLYSLGKTKEAADTLNNIYIKLSSVNPSPMRDFVHAAFLYVNGMASGTDEKKVFEVIRHLCPVNAERVRDIFRDPDHVLGKLYPVCDDRPLNEIRVGGCLYKELHDFFKKLTDIENSNPADPGKLQEICDS